MKKYILLLFCVSSVISSSQNLILNAGFETATVGLPNGTPLPPYPTLLNNWTAVNTDGEYMYSTTLANSGTGFLSVLQNSGGNPRTFWLGAAPLFNNYDRAIQIIGVNPNTNYKLQFWYRSGNSLRYGGYGDGRLLVQVEQTSPTNIAIDSASFYTPLNWTQATVNFMTGPSSNSVAILFSISSINPADGWVDDIDLKPAQPEGMPGLTENNNNVSISPNPINDKLKVINKIPNELLEISLYDINSRKIISEKFTESIILNTSELAKGVYFYEVTDKSGVIKKGKVIKP